MRVVLSLAVVGVLAVGLWYSLKNSPDSVPEHEGTNVQIAARHEAAVEDLAKALEASRKHAAEAEQIADRLDKAIRESQETSRELVSLQADSRIIETSVVSVREAARHGADAANVMRLYSERVDGQLAEATGLSVQAVEIAEALEQVEQSQLEAAAAVAQAQQVEEDISDDRYQESRPYARPDERDHQNNDETDRVIIRSPD